MSLTRIESTAYAGWPNCYRITNDEIELVVTTDVGPRIIHCGFAGGQNLFAELKDQLGKSGENEWKLRGGHRLWVAPEHMPDTYALDNGPVKATINGNRITLLQPVEPETFLKKEISIHLASDGTVVVSHRIENTGPKPRRLAPWGVSAMAPGGMAIAAFPPRGDHDTQLQPTHPLIMWAYTDFSDARWEFTKKYLILHGDPAVKAPQKAGLFNQKTFAAFLFGSDLFTKRFETNPDAPHADFHCSLELFTNGDFLEIETLGPLVDLLPDNSVGHVEHWSLHRNIHFDSLTDEAIDHVLLPLMK